MNKELIISVSPQEGENILNGNQTLLIRKSVPKDYKGWVNIYVKKAKPYLGYEVREYESEFILENDKDNLEYDLLNGKVVARFWLGQYQPIYTELIDMSGYDEDKLLWYVGDNLNNYGLLKKSCIECENDLEEYGQGRTLYAWHIKQLETFDEPLELSEFIKDFITMNTNENGKEVQQYEQPIPLTKAPTTYQYVWRKENE